MDCLQNNQTYSNQISNLLLNIQSPNDVVRKEAENIIINNKYNIEFYKQLLEVTFNKTNQWNLMQQIQGATLLKNLIYDEFMSKKKVSDFSSAQKNYNTDMNYENIISLMKTEIISFLYSSQNFNNQVMNQISALILTITDKYFPDNWNELHEFFYGFFSISFNSNNLFNEVLYNSYCYYSNLLYKILKQFSKKKMMSTKMKFYVYKKKYMELFIPFYQNMIQLFENNKNMFNNPNIVVALLNFLSKNDQILLKLIEISYSPSDFQNDSILMNLIILILQKSKSIMNFIAQLKADNPPSENIFVLINQNNLSSIIHHNLYKNIKYCGYLQFTNPILFYQNLDSYVIILFSVIENCNFFSEETIKATIFALSKLLKTGVYKDNSDEHSSESFSMLGLENFSNKTPEKKRSYSPPFSYLSSPAKYKNFEKELKSCIDTFSQIFTEKNVNLLLDNLLNKVPFVIKKDADNLEIQILTDFDDEHNDRIEYSNPSTNSMSFNILYNNLLENIVINFKTISIKYIKNLVHKIYKSENNLNNNESNQNYLLLDSFLNFIDILPYLLKQDYIKIIDMIDPSKYISFIEKFVPKSELIFRRYIITISKWSLILISNENIFDYLNKLIIFIQNVQNNYILIQSFLCINNILEILDKNMNKKTNDINTAMNKDLYLEKLKTCINWGSLLLTSTKKLEVLIPQITTTELFVSLINYFTCLIEKCHYQNEGEILSILKQTKFFDITINPKDEYTENVYSHMYSVLITNYSNSEEIFNLCLTYAEHLFLNSKNITINFWQYLLYILRVTEENDNIKKILFNFVQKNNNIFISNISSSYSKLYQTEIMEELVLYDIIPVGDINNILQVLYEKYKETYENFKTYYSQYISNCFENKDISSSIKKSYDMMLADLCENKTAILSTFITILNFYQNVKNENITNLFQNIFTLLFDEIFITYNLEQKESKLITSAYITNLLHLFERISINNYQLFQVQLQKYLELNNLNVCFFFTMIMSLMSQAIKIEVRKVNVYFISQMLPLLGFNFLSQNSAIIYDICYHLAYNDYIKIVQGMHGFSHEDDEIIVRSREAKVVRIVTSPNICTNNMKGSLKVINISKRKSNLIKNDQLILNFNAYNYFCRALSQICKNEGKTIEDMVRLLAKKKDEEIFIKMLKDIN